MSQDVIEQLDLFRVPPRWLFLKITTRDGLVGWGEPIVEGRAESVEATVRTMEEYLLGQDPGRIEDIFQVLYRGGFYRGGPVLMSAISGIDQALWDIKGKRLGVPVYDLLGGAVRDRMRSYCWVGGDEPEQAADAARARVDAGWSALKMNGVPRVEWLESPGRVRSAVAQVEAVREAVGWDVSIAVDFHGRVHKGLAKVILRELEAVKPMFVEEPVLPEHVDALADLAANTRIPLATGERLYGRSGFQEVLDRACVDIIQPDLSHAGGIWEVRKIAAQAEARDIAVAPHCPLGPIALAASLQLDFCTPNALIQETSLRMQYHEPTGQDLHRYVTDGGFFEWRDGDFLRNERPGLGVDIDEASVVAAAREGHQWRNPVWRQPDGSVAEW